MTTKPDSKWYTSHNAQRHRKRLELTLCAEARSLLDRAADEGGESRSLIIDSLILTYLKPRRPRN